MPQGKAILLKFPSVRDLVKYLIHVTSALTTVDNQHYQQYEIACVSVTLNATENERIRFLANRRLTKSRKRKNKQNTESFGQTSKKNIPKANFNIIKNHF